MKKLSGRSTRYILFLVFLFISIPQITIAAKKDPKVLLEQMTEAIGGIEGFRSKQDVQYVYIYRDTKQHKIDVSPERYIFDGELSWASYPVHERSVMPDSVGEVVQFYNGKKTAVTLNGEPVTDQKAISTADFLRKTNYYWFTMMFKLLDPGLIYSYEGKRQVDDINYDIVKVGFEAGVGDVADTYVLYIHPVTKLVDKFLFTVMDFGKKEPYMMEVRYSDISGLKIPTWRRYTKANWDGKLIDQSWTYELSINIQFANGFTPKYFELSG